MGGFISWLSVTGFASPCQPPFEQTCAGFSMGTVGPNMKREGMSNAARMVWPSVFWTTNYNETRKWKQCKPKLYKRRHECDDKNIKVGKLVLLSI